MTVLLLIVSVSLQASTYFSGLQSVEEIQARLAKIPEGEKMRLRGKLYSDLGTYLYRQNRMAEASQAYEQALASKTNSAMRRHIYLYLGKSYESSGRLDKAIAAYEEALGYDPKNWRRHRDLGGLYEQVKIYRKSREFYASARERNPREPSVWFVSGRNERRMGLYRGAEPYLLKAIDLGHDRHAVHREMSYVREGQGRWADAREEWRRGAGESQAVEDVARGAYLAIMAGDPGAKAEIDRLRAVGASKETVRLYENLAECSPSGLDALLTSRGKYPELESLVAAHLADKRAP